MKRTDFLRRRVSLQVKLVAILMVVVLTPFAASALFIDQVGKVAANFAAGEAAARDRAVAKALDAHLEWVALTKQLHAEVASLLARVPAIAAADPAAPLDTLLAEQRQLMTIRLVAADGAELARAARPPPPATTPYPVVHPLAGGATLEVTFAIPDHLQADYQELAAALDVARKVAQVRTALPSGYRTAFLALVGTAALAVVLVGVFAANRVTRRIAALVEVARAVSRGEGEARSRLAGRDEMAELGVAFDTMLDDLGRQRREIEYLQRIGAWQDVARRLAHEIKNPLTPIQMAMDTLRKVWRKQHPSFGEILEESTATVLEEVDRLKRIVSEFSDFARLPKPAPMPTDLNEVVAGALALYEGATPVERRLAPGLPAIEVDKGQMTQVLLNLVENARDAIADKADGAIVVSTRLGDAADRVELVVEDNGPGVPADVRDRVFTPYFTTKQGKGGTGLGLAIVHRIVGDHGGRITVGESARGGARVAVELPLRPGQLLLASRV